VKCSEVLQCSDVLLVLFYRSMYSCMFCILLFNSVSYVFILLRLCILIVMFIYSYYCYVIVKYALFCIHFAGWHSPTTLTEVFPCFFLSCKANARIYLAKTGHGPHSS
jgi:hypothetical protein